MCLLVFLIGRLGRHGAGLIVRISCGLRLTVDAPRILPPNIGRSSKLHLPCELAALIEGLRKKYRFQLDKMTSAAYADGALSSKLRTAESVRYLQNKRLKQRQHMNS